MRGTLVSRTEPPASRSRRLLGRRTKTSSLCRTRCARTRGGRHGCEENGRASTAGGGEAASAWPKRTQDRARPTDEPQHGAAGLQGLPRRRPLGWCPCRAAGGPGAQAGACWQKWSSGAPRAHRVRHKLPVCERSRNEEEVPSAAQTIGLRTRTRTREKLLQIRCARSPRFSAGPPRASVSRSESSGRLSLELLDLGCLRSAPPHS